METENKFYPIVLYQAEPIIARPRKKYSESQLNTLLGIKWHPMPKVSIVTTKVFVRHATWKDWIKNFIYHSFVKSGRGFFSEYNDWHEFSISLFSLLYAPVSLFFLLTISQCKLLLIGFLLSCSIYIMCGALYIFYMNLCNRYERYPSEIWKEEIGVKYSLG